MRHMPSQYSDTLMLQNMLYSNRHYFTAVIAYFELSDIAQQHLSANLMSYRTLTESIGPKLGFSRSDLADVVNSVCN